MKVFGIEVIIFWNFSLAAGVLGNDFHHLVQGLEDRINARTTVYYDLFESPLIEGMLEKSRLPNLVIREETEFELKTHYNSQILAVIFIESRFNDGLMRTLKKTLKDWYGTDMLFVTEDLVSKRTWKWLFDWCWSSGFYNVLLVSSQQPTKLLTYNKFPSLQIKYTTLTSYLEQRNVWRDFHGFQIRAGVTHEPPASIIYKNRSSGETILSGIYYQTVKMFTERHNSTLTSVAVAETTSCYNDLEENKLDICTGGAVFQTNQTYEMSVVPQTSSVYFMVPFARPLKKYEYFLLPFDLPNWIAILLAVGFIALANALLHWRHVGVWDFSGSLLTSFSSMLYLGFKLARATSRAKFLIYTIMIASGFIISNLYLAKLSSFLTTTVYEKQIDSVEDLLEKNITVLVTDYQNEISRSADIPLALRNQFKIVDTNSFHSYSIALNPEYTYTCISLSCPFLMHQQILMTRPRMKLVSQELFTTLVSFPLVDAWPLKDAFNDFILNVRCMGLYEKITRRVQEEALQAGLLQLYRTSEVEEDIKPLSMEDLQVALIIFVVGYSAALLAFCMEILIFYIDKVISRHQ